MRVCVLHLHPQTQAGLSISPNVRSLVELRKGWGLLSSVNSTHFRVPMSNPSCKWFILTLIYIDNYFEQTIKCDVGQCDSIVTFVSEKIFIVLSNKKSSACEIMWQIWYETYQSD